MGSNLLVRRALTGLILIAGIGAASPAMAGRCGHSYAVDTPTTLSKVARACNVSYAALVEANRGVDPGNVRPGEHLAVPDEIASAGSPVAPSPVVDNDVDNDAATPPTPTIRHPYIGRRPGASYQYYYEDRAAVRPINASMNATSPSTYFDTNITPVHASRNSGLSYQKLSAARIRNAGYSAPPIERPRSIFLDKSGVIKSVSAYPTPLLECSVLRRQPDGKIRQVREVKIGSDQEETPAHCISLRLNEPVRAIVTRGSLSSEASIENLTVLRGRVLAVSDECVTLESNDGEIWRMQAPIAASDMLGKDATIWAAYTRALSCGGLVLNHAVYAERL